MTYSEKVIIADRTNGIPYIYDFVHENETEQEAEDRAFLQSMESMKMYSEYHLKYPNVLEDGSEYWENRFYEENAKIYKVVSYDEFIALERAAIINEPLQETTEEKFNEMLDVLPPLSWTSINNVEMFCMREMYTGTYTTQYAYDHKTDKYYCKMVDITDKSTWINNYIGK